MKKEVYHHGDKKVALVTGGGRGIGRAIALKLASQDIGIALNFKTDVEAAHKTKKLIKQQNVPVFLYQSDVSNYTQVEKMIKQIVLDFGHLDILVNNAGILKDRRIERMTEEDWDNVLDVNLKSVFNCTKFALPYLRKSKSGRIVNISSVMGLAGNFGQANYAASKAGIIGLTKALAIELAKDKITVNAVAPGIIETEILAHLPPGTIEKYLMPKIPLGELGTVKDVAEIVSFLIEEAARYITGQVISVNGGYYM